MPIRWTRAIVRRPGANFAAGLTAAELGAPDVALALEQHARYREALEQAGLVLTELPENSAHPDATFVEDTAVLSPRCNVITRPGAPSRADEVTSVRAALARLGVATTTMEAPGTLDGGDVSEAGDHFFIGISRRTNREGASQLQAFLAQAGYATSLIDIRDVPGLLHLKSGLAALDDERIVAIDPLRDHPALRGFEIVRVPAGEEYAANCVRVNDVVLVPTGYPRMQRTLERLGCEPVMLDMSEFRKMDGGLSCLSLRF